MQTIFTDRSFFLQTLAVSLVTYSTVALLAVVLAYWTWVWFAPRAEVSMPPVLQTAGKLENVNGLFGSGQQLRNVAAPTGIAIKLLGIVAATDGRSGYAVVQMDSKKTLAVQQGDVLAPGVLLKEVAGDHLVLERNGVLETLAWTAKKTSGKSSIQKIESK